MNEGIRYFRNPQGGYLEKIITTEAVVAAQPQIVKDAYQVAKEAHRGHDRKSGLPYFNHLVDVYRVTKDEFGIDNPIVLAAALLHDGPEDGRIELVTIRTRFGDGVADLVDAMTKIEDLEGTKDVEGTFQKLLDNPDTYVYAMILKLADRLSNTRDHPLNGDKQIKKALETRDIVAEMAEALGIWTVRNELKDRAFRDLDPELYATVQERMEKDLRRDETFQRAWVNRINDILHEGGIEASVKVREAGYAHIQDKLERKASRAEASLDEYERVNDVVSFRIIVEDLEQLDKVVPLILRNAKLSKYVLNNALDNYIGPFAQPNEYQAYQIPLSLRDKDIDIGDIEIAIVTKDMEDYNNWGIVSLIRKGIPDFAEHAPKIAFVDGNIRFMRETSSRGIDWAYRVYPNIARRATGFMIGDEFHPLSDNVPHGASIQFVFDKNKQVQDEGILEFALPQTRLQLEADRKRKERQEVIEKGREILLQNLEQRGVLLIDHFDQELLSIVDILRYDSIDDLLYRLGFKSVTIEGISKLMDEHGYTKKELGYTGVQFSGVDETGILASSAAQIRDCGGSIKYTDEQYFDLGDSTGFVLTYLVRNMDQQGEQDLLTLLNQRYQNVKVV